MVNRMKRTAFGRLFWCAPATAITIVRLLVSRHAVMTIALVMLPASKGRGQSVDASRT